MPSFFIPVLLIYAGIIAYGIYFRTQIMHESIWDFRFIISFALFFIILFYTNIVEMTAIIIMAPWGYLFDKLNGKPEAPLMIYLTLERDAVSYQIKRKSNLLKSGRLVWDKWYAACDENENKVILDGVSYNIGQNNSMYIYNSKDKQWLDIPKERIIGTIKLSEINKNIRGYIASQEEQKREEEWNKEHESDI